MLVMSLYHSFSAAPLGVAVLDPLVPDVPESEPRLCEVLPRHLASHIAETTPRYIYTNIDCVSCAFGRRYMRNRTEDRHLPAIKAQVCGQACA